MATCLGKSQMGCCRPHKHNFCNISCIGVVLKLKLNPFDIFILGLGVGIIFVAPELLDKFIGLLIVFSSLIVGYSNAKIKRMKDESDSTQV